MAKKSRRAKDKRRTGAAKAVQERRPQQPEAIAAEPQSPARVLPRTQDLAGRYQYVMPELKRIGIIAGAIIVVLIVLSFVLPYIPHW
ncbi:MAG: hypothetical protein R6U93_01185 [Dehalococcoidia bacterium]